MFCNEFGIQLYVLTANFLDKSVITTRLCQSLESQICRKQILLKKTYVFLSLLPY